MNRRASTPPRLPGVALALLGAAIVALPAWRAQRLPALLAAAVPARTGLSWDSNGLWSVDTPAAPPRSVVLLVHGLDEPGGIWDVLAPAVASTGRRVARFDYPNDQHVPDSADLLIDALGDLRDLGVERVEIVAHSMGGLVARDALTRLDAPPRPDVPLLITLGTPHAGSPWAKFQTVSEMREQVQRWAESDDLDLLRLFGFVADGVGQAAADLAPGSDFLTDLDDRPWPEGTRVVCVVAVAADVPLDAGVDGLPATPAAVGDGVVPAPSAAWDRADETLLVHANHRSMVRPIEIGQWIRRTLAGDPSPAPEPPAVPLVLERLAPPLPETPDASGPTTPDSQTPP